MLGDCEESPDIIVISSSPELVTRSLPPTRPKSQCEPTLKVNLKPDVKPAFKTKGEARKRTFDSKSRSRVTERMLNTLNSSQNPISHSNQFERTAHVQSASSGHQQRGADRGFWAKARDANVKVDSASATYWSVRTASVEAGARAKTTDILAGCTISINGPTGPLVSNLQLQNLITSNGGRYSPHQHGGCTHVVAARLSGTKSQKHINGQGSRGASRRAQVVKVEWVLDCIKQGRRLNESGYSVVADPSQQSLHTAFGVPKAEASASSTAAH